MLTWRCLKDIQVGLSSKHTRHETLDMFLDILKAQFPQVGNAGTVVPAHSSWAVVRIEGDGV